MRILTLGGKMLTAALRQQGHEVMHLGPPGTAGHPQERDAEFFQHPESARTALRGMADAFRPEWILQVDDSFPLVHAGLESLSIPKAWYAVDSHLHFEWHRHFAPLFDVVFCAQKNLVASLDVHRGSGRGVEWLPLSCKDEPVFLPWAARAFDVSFVGTLDAALNPARAALLEGLKARGQAVHVAQGDFHPIYRDSRVVLNQSVHDDLNLRFFEAIGQGALLITDRISHSLAEIGTPGAEFLVYEPGDADDLLRNIRWALAHPVEAEAIARRGQERVMREHRMAHRLGRMAEVFTEMSALSKPMSSHRLAHLSAAHEHLSRLSLPAPLTAFFAGEARRLAMAALETCPAEPFALLVLAQLDLERGVHAEALGWLERTGGAEGGGGYGRRYAALRALLLAHGGRMVEARQAARAGLREYPDDGDLQALVRVLGG
jgi:hypothetical protein